MTRSWLGIAAIVTATLIVTHQPVQADGDAPDGEFHASVKIVDWSADEQIGVAKAGKEYVAFRVGADTVIRIDRAVSGVKVHTLESIAMEAYSFSKKDPYQVSTYRTKGVLKPRFLLATGYGIAPLPTGRAIVPGGIGLIGWNHVPIEEWAAPGYATVNGQPWDLGISALENVLVGTKGSLKTIKKGKKVHIDGTRSGETFRVRKNGKLAFGKKAENFTSSNSIEIPMVAVTRYVVPNKAFRAVYRYMWPETFKGR